MNKYKKAYDVIDAFLWSVRMEESERNPTLDEAEEAMDDLDELVEKVTPKKPIFNKENKSKSTIEFTCPTCCKVTHTKFLRNYCGECGQRLDWSKEDD